MGTNAEKFVKLYINLENAIREKYGYDGEPVLNAARNELAQYKNELDTLRRMRNVLSHSRVFRVEECAEPHSKMITTLTSILEEVDNTIVYKHCVRIENVLYAGLDDKVLPILNKMRENVYTHIPILDERKRVIGVFGESTLMHAVTDCANNNDLQLLDNETTFRDFKKYIGLDSHTTESFMFISRMDTLVDCRYNFMQTFNSDKKRLGMMFITHNGREDETLLGIITAWGVLGREFTN